MASASRWVVGMRATLLHVSLECMLGMRAALLRVSLERMLGMRCALTCELRVHADGAVGGPFRDHLMLQLGTSSLRGRASTSRGRCCYRSSWRAGVPRAGVRTRTRTGVAFAATSKRWIGTPDGAGLVGRMSKCYCAGWLLSWWRSEHSAGAQRIGVSDWFLLSQGAGVVARVRSSKNDAQIRSGPRRCNAAR
jgi:hypothetical protein